MDLESLRVFVRVAELASFTRAAEQLGIAKAGVSAAVAQLEQQLGTRPLQRTTRSVRLTPDGEQFFKRCQRLLADADELQTLFQNSASALRGRLRLDMPILMARNFVIPRLPEFLAAHPELEIELSTTDRRVDLVHEAFDCVLCVGALPDSSLVARPLGRLRLVNCASPAYLQRHSTPQTLQDLQQHQLVHYAPTLGAQPLGFEYRDGDRWTFLPMRGNVAVNNSDAYQAACLAGLGIVQVPAVGVQPLVDQGLLVHVLPQFTGAPMDWLAHTLEPHLDQ